MIIMSNLISKPMLTRARLIDVATEVFVNELGLIHKDLWLGLGVRLKLNAETLP